MLRQIQHLYTIEADLRAQGASAKGRVVRRGAQARPVLRRIHQALLRLRASGRNLPQGQLGKAITYTLNIWPQLEVYGQDGRIEIDNNGVENAIRPTAIRKKNWLFIGEAEAGQRSAIIYSLIESCRRRGIDPHAWLLDARRRLPGMKNHQIKELTPQACALARSPQKKPENPTAAQKQRSRQNLTLWHL